MFDQLETAHDDTPVPGAQDEAVRSWRFDQFVRLGFDNVTAFALMLGEADLGLARRLVREGCPLRVALAILD